MYHLNVCVCPRSATIFHMPSVHFTPSSVLNSGVREHGQTTEVPPKSMGVSIRWIAVLM